MEKTNQDKKNRRSVKRLSPYLKFTTLALQMGLTIYLGSELGDWLDFKFSTTFCKPSVTLFSVFLAIYMVINQVTKISNNS